jgi:hypothetical protein
MKVIDAADELIRPQALQDRSAWGIMHYMTWLTHQRGYGMFLLDPGRCSSRPVTWHIDSDHPLQNKHEKANNAHKLATNVCG